MQDTHIMIILPSNCSGGGGLPGMQVAPNAAPAAAAKHMDYGSYGHVAPAASPSSQAQAAAAAAAAAAVTAAAAQIPPSQLPNAHGIAAAAAAQQQHSPVQQEHISARFENELQPETQLKLQV